MREIKRRVLPIRIIAKCDNCYCDVVSMGKHTLSIPPIYFYKCENCNIEYQSTEVYPRVAYVDRGPYEKGDGELIE